MGTFLSNIKALNAAGASPPVAGTFVVYDLPDRDCSALASNGEYTIADNGVVNYKAYIDAIKAILVQYSDVKTILVIGMSLEKMGLYDRELTICRTRLLSKSRHKLERCQMF